MRKFYFMAYSKIWLSLTPEEKKIKRKEYQDRYKKKHPNRVIEQRKKYVEKHKNIIRKKASEWQKEKGRINKLKAIKYLGGKCIDCDNVFPPYIYDFHHLDSSEKEASIARIMGRTWKNIIPELDKCILLCSNCHRTRHHKDD